MAAKHLDRELERQIQSAIDGDTLAMVFQPIVDVTSMEPVGYEALSRFDLEPRRPPDRWFAAAEQIGRGVELQVAAIDRALAVLPQLPTGCYLAINISPEAVLAPSVQTRLDGLTDPDRIVVEITENVPVDDYEALLAALKPHRDRGLRVAIDDTGSGYASLRHILRLDPDIMKLDRSITLAIDRERSARAMAASLCMFALETGIMVVAEGIETSSQLLTMQALGATSAQGYLLGRPAAVPVPAAAGA